MHWRVGVRDLEIEVEADGSIHYLQSIIGGESVPGTLIPPGGSMCTGLGPGEVLTATLQCISHQDADDINDDDLLLRRHNPSIHTAPLPDGKRILVGFAFREKHNHEFSMYVAREVSPEKVLSCGLPTQK